MATAPQPTPGAIELPSECYGRSNAGSSQIGLSDKLGTILILRDKRDAPDFIEARSPIGARGLTVTGRLCGDWYAELKLTGRAVCAIGDTPRSAALNVFAKAA